MTGTLKSIVLSALLIAAAPALAAESDDHASHHPAEAGSPPAAPPQKTSPQNPAAGMMMMDGGMKDGSMMSMMGMMGGPDAMVQHVEGRIAALKVEWKITKAQLPLWNAFAETLRSNAKTMNRMMESMMGPDMMGKSLPDRLDQHEKMMSSQLKALHRTTATLRRLYAAMDDEQKKIADATMMSMSG